MRRCSAAAPPIWIFAASLILVGCGGRAPPLETWPVRGTVIDQDGQSPTDGVVRFLTESDPHLITVGPIQSDGSFTVRTQRQGFTYQGAVPGDYHIAVLTSATGAGGSPAPVRFDLQEPLRVEAADNQFTLEIRR